MNRSSDNIGGVNKGQPRAIINTFLPSSAREGTKTWKDGGGGRARSSLGSEGFD